MMPVELVLQPSPDAVALLEKREQLAAVRGTLAERESDLAQLRAQLKNFEGRYLRQVGVLYAELDEWEARIAEREAELYDSEPARRRAEDARRQARETHDSAFGDASEAAEFDPPASLKTLFRDVAKRIHPDFARDEAEQKYFTLLMARANEAYGRGDAETLQRLLDDHREINAAGADAGESAAAEILRIARQIRHAERDMARLDFERQTLLSSEIAQLHFDAEAAAREHRDLLSELAAGLREQIADAQRRFELVAGGVEQATAKAECWDSSPSQAQGENDKR
jgi:chromosome segregation ATPase